MKKGIHINDNIVPKTFRSRNVPIPLQVQVSAEIGREDVLEPIDIQ